MKPAVIVVEKHLHIATHLHPTVSLSSLVKDIKVSSSVRIKEKDLFPAFIGWGIGYGTFTYTIKEKSALVGYIRNQEKHHNIRTFREEYKDLMQKHQVNFKEKYMLE